MEITTYKKAAAYINEAIPSPAVKMFVFGTETVSHHDIKGIDSIYKLLITEFLVVYLRWLNSGRNELRDFKTLHYTKAAEVMDLIYRGQKLNLDTIMFVLAEGQKDVLEVGEASFFFPLIDASDSCKFGKLYSLIDEWKDNLQTSETVIEVILNGFVAAARFSKALSKTDISYSRHGETISAELIWDGEPLNTWDILYTDRIGNRYVLIDKGYDKENALYHYMAIDDFNIVTVIKKANRR